MDGLKHNLLNISQLCDKGNKVTFTFAGCKVKKVDTKEVILTANKYKNVPKEDILDMPGSKLKCLGVIANDPLLWHKRLGHVSLNQLNKLASKDMVIGLPKTKFKNDKVCSACVRGKQVR